MVNNVNVVVVVGGRRSLRSSSHDLSEALGGSFGGIVLVALDSGNGGEGRGAGVSRRRSRRLGAPSARVGRNRSIVFLDLHHQHLT